MKRIPTMVLAVVALCGSAFCQVSAEFSSYYAGRRYDFRLTREQLLVTPAWSEDEPNPPVSFRAAKTAALGYLESLFNNADAWRLEEIKLVPLRERWVYVVSFTPPPPPNCLDCLASPFGIVVTMDGNAVTATISHWNPPLPSVE